ncbi:hypothetical protein ACFFRR_001340 [Megaselia abdita]
MIVTTSTFNSTTTPTTISSFPTTMPSSTQFGKENISKDRFTKSKIVNQLESSIIFVNKSQSNQSNTIKKDNKSTSRLSNKNNMVLPTPIGKYALTTIITDGKKSMIIVYPTVSPESIVIPIVSCILGFPLLALLIICCLRRRAKLARERERRRNYDLEGHAVSLVRFSPIHRLNNRPARAISLHFDKSLNRGFPSLELDTVVEEHEQTITDIISPDSPLEFNNAYRATSSSS